MSVAVRNVAWAGLAVGIAMAFSLLVPHTVAAAGSERLPVPAVTIYPGDTIAADMLTDAGFPSGTTANYPVIGAPSELVGKVARRTLLPGRLIARNAVGEPELVQKGKIVAAIYESGALRITASVVALQSGSLDDAIQVRNVDSGKVIVGTVAADGSVRVAGP